MKTLALFFLSVVICSSQAYCLELPETEYYALMMDGKKIGYVESSRVVTDDIVTTADKTKMSIGRMGVMMTVTSTDTSVETTAGKPISFESLMDASIMKTRTTGKFLGNGKVEITSEQMGTIQKKTIDYPKGALMVEGLRLLQIEKGLAEGTLYTAKLFVPQFQSAVDAEVSVGSMAQTDLFGRVVSLAEIKVTMQMPAGPGMAATKMSTTSYVDKEFRAQKTVVPAMGMNLVMIACDKEFAMSADDQVDFLDKLLLDSPRKLKLDGKIVKGKLTYTIKPVGRDKITIPSGDNQKVIRKEDGTLIVTVDPAKAHKSRFPYKGKDPEILRMLKPTMYLQCDDEKIITLAKQATKGIKDASIAVGRIETFVGEYISEKNLSVGYATASEVAVSKQGDCSEHAVLTAAMCRAIGIPARVVVGLVYVEEFGHRKNIFGGHAWTQAYIGGKWIGIDATRGYGAGHIELATGSGDPSDFFAMVNILGYFKIAEIK